MKKRITKQGGSNNDDRRICKYCGWDMDESNIEMLIFFHSDCWKEYRKDGLVYPMPKHV